MSGCKKLPQKPSTKNTIKVIMEGEVPEGEVPNVGELTPQLGQYIPIIDTLWDRVRADLTNLFTNDPAVNQAKQNFLRDLTRMANNFLRENGPFSQLLERCEEEFQAIRTRLTLMETRMTDIQTNQNELRRDVNALRRDLNDGLDGLRNDQERFREQVRENYRQGFSTLSNNYPTSRSRNIIWDSRGKVRNYPRTLSELESSPKSVIIEILGDYKLFLIRPLPKSELLRILKSFYTLENL